MSRRMRSPVWPGDVADDRPAAADSSAPTLSACAGCASPPVSTSVWRCRTIGAQRHDGLRRPKAAAQEADAVQVPQPFSVRDIALPPRHVLHVPRIDQVHREAARLEDLVHRNPIHARRFHRHTRHPTRHEPVRQAMRSVVKVRNDCTGVGIPIGRHGDHVGGRATINPRRIGIEAVQHRGRRTWPARTAGTGQTCRLLPVNGASGDRETVGEQTPKRDHHGRACHH